MRSPAAAIAWQLGRNHRWGMSAVALYLVTLAAIKLLIGEEGLPFGANEELRFSMFVVVPLSATVYYLLAMFSFGFAGDLAGRHSVYPARMFTLPVTTTGLVGWPMLYGGLAMVVVWTTTRLFAFWPTVVTIPIFWPGLMAAVLLAWTQALMWTSYGLRGLRVFAIVSWLSLLSIVVQVAVFYQTSEPAMLALLAPQLPAAYLVARAGVAAARRGDVRDWRAQFALWRRLFKRSHRRPEFRSSAHAQAWFEWRRHGYSLPTLVAILLPFELVLLFAARGAPALILTILIIVMVTPPFMALFVAATVRKVNPTGSDGYGLTPFIATRPMTSAGLIAAKLTMAIRSTLLTWLLVLGAIPIALYLSDTGQVVTDFARRMVEAFGTPRFVALVLLGFAAVVATTLKQLVQSLYIGLSGRPWLVKSSVFGALFLVTIGSPVLVWLVENFTAVLRWWHVVPWILATLTAIKLIGAGWTVTRLRDARLIDDRTLVAGTLGWFILVVGVYGVIVWVLATPLLPTYLILLVTILATPLTRVAASPIALEWNRHR